MIRKGRDVAHVYATTYNDSPPARALKSLHDQISYRRKDYGGIELLRRLFIRAPGKGSTKTQGKFSSCQVTGARKSKDLNLFVQSDLGYDMRCRPETIDTEILTCFQIGKLERTPAYQAGTKKRRQLNIRITFRRFENIVLIGNSILCKATIYGITGK